MDNLIAREPGDVAADKLGVHADGAPGYLVLLDLLGRQVLIDLLVEVDMLGIVLLVLGNAAEQLLVGVDGRALVVDIEKTHGLTPNQVEADVLVQLLIATTATLLQNAHRNKDTELLRGSTHVALYKERTKDFLIDVQQDVAMELVVPRQLVFHIPALTLRQGERCRSEQDGLGFLLTLLECHVIPRFDSTKVQNFLQIAKCQRAI